VSNVKKLIASDAKALDNEINQTIVEIRELDSQDLLINTTITAKTQHLAELLEEKWNRAGTPQFVNTICAQILRLFSDNGLSHRKDVVLRALPDRYKLLRKTSSHLGDSRDKRTEESSVVEEIIGKFFHEHNNMALEDFTKRQIQDFLEDGEEFVNRLKDYCEDNGIPLSSAEDDYDWVDALNEQKDPPVPLEKAPDATDKPGPDSKAWFRLASICERIGKARMDYPNHDPVRKHKEVQAVTALCNMWEPLVNRKYRYHYGQMNKMMHEAVSQSGTAAASHSGVICAGITNPKTGLPELRKITKEQLDAIQLPFYNRVNHMLYHLPMLGEVTDYAYEQFAKEDATYLARRAYLVGPKLQKIK
jgi:hypothetical protein